MGSKNSGITEQVDNRLDDLFGGEDVQDDGGGEEPMAEEEAGNQTTDGELNNRLDNFFKKENNPEKKSETPAVDSQTLENSHVKDLKSVVLSLEWEITDQVMQKLGEEITKLENECRDDKIVIAFLQLLGSLGKYIRKKRAEAHPDSIRLLHSVYDNLEIVLVSDDMTEAAKKKMLVAQVDKYKQLKTEITVSKSHAASKTDDTSAENRSERESREEKVSSSDDSGYRLSDDTGDAESPGISPEPSAAVSDSIPDIQKILLAMEDIRTTIQHEFSALREELRLMRENQ